MEKKQRTKADRLPLRDSKIDSQPPANPITENPKRSGKKKKWKQSLIPFNDDGLPF